MDPPDFAWTDHPGYCCIDILTGKKVSDRRFCKMLCLMSLDVSLADSRCAERCGVPSKVCCNQAFQAMVFLRLKFCPRRGRRFQVWAKDNILAARSRFMPVLAPILGQACRLTLSWINAKPEIGRSQRRDITSWGAAALVLNPTVAPTPQSFVCCRMRIIPMGCDRPILVMSSCPNTVYFWKV